MFSGVGSGFEQDVGCGFMDVGLHRSGAEERFA